MITTVVNNHWPPAKCQLKKSLGLGHWPDAVDSRYALPCGLGVMKEVGAGQLKYLLPRLVGQGSCSAVRHKLVLVDLGKVSWSWTAGAFAIKSPTIERHQGSWKEPGKPFMKNAWNHLSLRLVWSAIPMRESRPLWISWPVRVLANR